jgi:hypothetical protein
MSIINGIFKGIWGGFKSLNDMLRSGDSDEVIVALGVYLILFVGAFVIYYFATSGSNYTCVEWRDDGIRSYYYNTTKTTQTRHERTCMVMVHKEFTGSVEVR